MENKVPSTKKRALYVAHMLEDAANKIRTRASEDVLTEDLAEFVVHEVLWTIPNTGIDALFRDVRRDAKDEE